MLPFNRSRCFVDRCVHKQQVENEYYYGNLCRVGHMPHGKVPTSSETSKTIGRTVSNNPTVKRLEAAYKADLAAIDRAEIVNAERLAKPDPRFTPEGSTAHLQ